MRLWRSWGSGWIVRFGHRRWICGSASWSCHLKKTVCAAEQDRPDVAEKRAHWPENFLAIKTEDLVFIDESGANTKMARLRGRAPKNKRLVCKIPFGHYHSNTMIAAIGLSGPFAEELLDGAMNGPRFLKWVNEKLVPKLQKGKLVIMDNLATHKVKGVREAIEKIGAGLLYLPPYSPDFNPIENMWSKVKNHLRSSAPRTFDELLLASKNAIASITASDAKGFFLNAHYSI